MLVNLPNSLALALMSLDHTYGRRTPSRNKKMALYKYAGLFGLFFAGAAVSLS